MLKRKHIKSRFLTPREIIKWMDVNSELNHMEKLAINHTVNKRFLKEILPLIKSLHKSFYQHFKKPLSWKQYDNYTMDSIKRDRTTKTS